MAFGDRKARFRSPSCANEGCARPAHIDGLCAACYRAQTPTERKINAEYHEGDFDIDAAVDSVIAGFEHLLDRAADSK